MVMLGYEPGSKAYRLYDPVKKRIHVSRDVVFNEGEGWKWGELDGKSTNLTVESWTMSPPPVAAAEKIGEGESGIDESPAPTPQTGPRASLGPDTVGRATSPPQAQPIHFVSPPADGGSENLDI